MTASEYQKKAHTFACYGNGGSMYPLFGLAEEAGEVCGKVAKFMRKHDLDPHSAAQFVSMIEPCEKFDKDLRKELGDVLWMVAEVATTFEINLDEVMEENIQKLKDRRERGVIIGEGDNR